ncbi:MAG: DNA polymerase III subunit delta [Candidatus Yanofskybacteria bacterium]|nr:DNA polymerase III subunit delta [Candidatus Yanofskybacteria bacterium]
MFHFFYGQENFSVKEAVKKKTADFLKTAPDLIIEKIDINQEGGVKSLKDALETRSIFNEGKIVIANALFANGQTQEAVLEILKKYFQDPEKNFHLIFYEFYSGPELNKKGKKLFQFLSQNAPKSGEILPLKSSALEKWCIEEFKSAGLKIQVPMARKLLFLVSQSQEKAKNEIAKLIAYKNFDSQSKDKEVKEADLDKIVAPELTLNNFDLTDTMAGKNQRKAILLLDRYLSEGEDPYAILGLVIYQFRVLLRIKSLTKKAVPYSQLAGLSKLHPFVIRKNYENARKFEMEDLKRIYQELRDADINAKNGVLNLSDFLFSFLMKN